MNFRGPKKLILMVSHDHWVRNRKIVFYGILKEPLSLIT